MDRVFVLFFIGFIPSKEIYMARYCSLFSGSSGNSTYFGTAHGGILVDVGVSAKRINTALCDRGIDPDGLQGLFITHEHTDHVSGLRVFLKQHPMPVYATAGTARALLEKGVLKNFFSFLLFFLHYALLLKSAPKKFFGKRCQRRIDPTERNHHSVDFRL